MPVIITDKDGNVYVLAGIRDLSYSPATGLTTSPNSETLCTGVKVRVRNRGDDVVEVMLSAQAEISQSASRSKSESRRRSRSRSASKYPSRSRWKSRSKSRSRLQSLSQSVSKSGSRSVSVSMSLSKSESRARSESKSQSKTKSKSKTKSISRSQSVSKSLSKTKSKSVSKSLSKTRSRSQSASKSRSLSQSKSASKSASRSKSRSHSASASKSRSRENLWYCVNRQVYVEECVGETESETRMCVRGKDIISECTISEGPPVRFTIDVVVDGPYATEEECLAHCISASRSRSISKWKLPKNTCNDCVPRLPDDMYVILSGAAGDFAIFNGGHALEWLGDCTWVKADFSISLTYTGTAWNLGFAAKPPSAYCTLNLEQVVKDRLCNPFTTDYQYVECTVSACDDAQSCANSAGATAEVTVI